MSKCRLPQIFKSRISLSDYCKNINLRPCCRIISNLTEGGVGEVGRLFEHRPESKRELGRPCAPKSSKAILLGVPPRPVLLTLDSSHFLRF